MPVKVRAVAVHFNSLILSFIKYLKILRSIPKAEYISKRAEIMISLKANNFDEAIELLSNAKKDYEGDLWISEKLARIYSQSIIIAYLTIF